MEEQREIKFRAYDVKNKKMWYSDDLPEGSRLFLFFSGYEGNTLHNNHHYLMQYTGLKDKNGKEIYDGDILSHPEDQDEMEYFEKDTETEAFYSIEKYYVVVKWNQEEVRFMISPDISITEILNKNKKLKDTISEGEWSGGHLGDSMPEEESKYMNESIVIGNIYQNAELLNS